MNESLKLEKLDKEILERKDKLKEDTLHYLLLKKESSKKESSINSKLVELRSILIIQNEQLQNVNNNIHEINDKIKLDVDEINQLNKIDEKQLENEKNIYRQEMERIKAKKQEIELIKNIEINSTNEEIHKISLAIQLTQSNIDNANKSIKDKIKGDIRNRRMIIAKNTVFKGNKKTLDNLRENISNNIKHLSDQISSQSKENKKRSDEINLKLQEINVYYTTIINAKSVELNTIMEDIESLHLNVVNKKSLNWIKNLESKEDAKIGLCDEINTLNQNYNRELQQYESLLNSNKMKYETIINDLTNKKENEEMKLKNLCDKEQKQLSNMYNSYKINTENIRQDKGSIYNMIEELHKLNTQKYQLELTLNQFKLDAEINLTKLENEYQNANERLFKISSRIHQTKPSESHVLFANEKKLVTLRGTAREIQKNIHLNNSQVNELERQLKANRDKLWNSKKDLKTQELVIFDKVNQRNIIQKKIDRAKFIN